jgi:hypothetical protein
MAGRLLLVLCSVAGAGASAGENLCLAGEQVIFACATGRASKIVSMCASPDLAAGKGSLYYRFGTRQKIELAYPDKANGNPEHFRYAHYSRFQTERSEVTFSIGKYAYTVFDYYDGGEKPEYHRGVQVTPGSQGRESVFACKGQVTSNLHRLEGTIPCDEGSALARCD